MGAFGILYNGARATYAMATHNDELLDKATRSAKKSILSSVIDPIGIFDAVEAASTVADVDDT